MTKLTDFNKTTADDSMSIIQELNHESYSDSVINLMASKKNLNTGTSQGFYDRLARFLNSISQNPYKISRDQLVFTIGTLIGGHLIMSNTSPDYRIDKSPTVSLQEHLNILNELEDEYFKHDDEINDQPNYSHNEAIKLAKKIGFPTEYEL